SVPSSSSTKNGFPSARWTTTSRSPDGNVPPSSSSSIRTASSEESASSSNVVARIRAPHPGRCSRNSGRAVAISRRGPRVSRTTRSRKSSSCSSPHSFPDFAHDPCPADPRIPEDRYELWFPPVLDLRVGSLEHLHLFVTADEGAAKAADTARTHERKSADEASALDPSRLPLGLDRLSFPELERATRGRD